ncbi:pYEATS domain-containing protein [Sphingomonas sp. 35-24ZXX]|uniref:pYEATS domain-containing protein n=1 Tax=Sphingomonas sp. 35-24ZXX TaxID=1545915 RepID=UPI00053BED2D|nr:pYEATS domain-containing protein [Sphingomonas sp. 35-24ZXX]
MSTSLKFVAPPDLSVGRVRISNQAGLVHDWVATPGDLTMPTQAAEPGYYTVEIAPAGVPPQSVIFQVKEGQANNVTLPSFSALMASGSGPSFLGVDDEEAALRTFFQSQPRKVAPLGSEITPVQIDATRKRISVGISQEAEGRRESFGPFTGTYRYDMVGDRVSIKVESGDGWDPWSGRRVRMTTSIEGLKIERQLLPMYRGGTTIGIVPSPLATADVEYQVTPAEPHIRALLRALQGGTSDEAAALGKTILNPERLGALLAPQTGDPWAALLAGLLFIRFPDSFGPPHREWTAALGERVDWAYDAHVVLAHNALSAADGTAVGQRAAAEHAIRLLARAQARGSPYYSYANQIFGEMAESLQSFLSGVDTDAAQGAATVLARWRRETPLQSSRGVTFTWLSRNKKALKEKSLLTAMQSPSGQLRARDTTVVLSGVIERGRVTLARGVDTSKPKPPAKVLGVRNRTERSPRSGVTAFALKTRFRRATAPLPTTATMSSTSPTGPTGRKATDDPNRGRYGRKAEVAGFRVDATFKPGANRNWVTVLMTVTADSEADLQLGDVAWFDLHPSFPQRRIKVMFNDRRATLSVQAWGGFTLGIDLPRQGIKLECDLAKLKDAPSIIKTR